MAVVQWRRLLGVAAVVALVVTACGGDDSHEVVVSAAASLTDGFSALEDEFERENPNIDLILNFAGSSVLRDQIIEGAPVDVFAPAAPGHIDVVVAAGIPVSDPVTFAINRLVLAVPAGNPAGVAGLVDLARDELLVGLCAVGVPCGDLADELLASEGVAAAPDTREADVRALLTKLAAGELDVGLVYATDVTGSDGDVQAIVTFAEPQAEYRVVVVDGTNPGAELFVAMLTSDVGRRILVEHGFGSP